MSLHNTLYVLPTGKPKSSGSYSSRDTFKFCRRKFFLQRVLGWRHNREGAALDLGKITEAAVVYQLVHGRGGVEEFARLWSAFKATPDFKQKEYTKVEESWENCLRIGTEWMTIFALRAARYPFYKPQFQTPLSKKIFPGTSYDAITNVAYLDILSWANWNHPLLTPVPQPMEMRPVITDVKTASKALPVDFIGLDPQLIEYAWMYLKPGAPAMDVAFLWFVKKSHGVKSGSRVTLLGDCSPFKAGDEVSVLDKISGSLDAWIGTQTLLDAYDKACRGPDGKSLKNAALDKAAAAFLAISPAVRVPLAHVSKQLVQFASARISRANIEEMGKVIGQTTVEMVVAHETGFYPMEPGLRFPSEKCGTCDMRFICTGDSAGRDRFLRKFGEEWRDTTIEE